MTGGKYQIALRTGTGPRPTTICHFVRHPIPERVELGRGFRYKCVGYGDWTVMYRLVRAQDVAGTSNDVCAPHVSRSTSLRRSLKHHP